MNYNVRLTLKSVNTKTGEMPVSTTESSTCPDICPLKGEGCFAQSGPLSLIWKETDERRFGFEWQEFCGKIADLPELTVWRHNQAGDLPGDGRDIDRPALTMLIDANTGRRGFTYSHYDVIHNLGNRAAIRAANAEGFTVNLSANNLAHADALARTRCGPVAVILPSSTPKLNKLVYTPEGRKVCRLSEMVSVGRHLCVMRALRPAAGGYRGPACPRRTEASGGSRHTRSLTGVHQSLNELRAKRTGPIHLTKGCRVMYNGPCQSLRGKKGTVDKVRKTPRGRRAIVTFDHDSEDSFDVYESSLVVLWGRSESEH